MSDKYAPDCFVRSSTNTSAADGSRRRRHHRAGSVPRRGLRGIQPERLEDRVLLAVGPQLIAVQPNSGDVLRDGVVRHEAPRELTLVFNEQQQIDAATLDGIQITRAGFDEAFDGVSDVVVQPGFVGVDPDRPNRVIVRFAEALPDDLYRIDILAVDDPGRGLVALRNVQGDPFVPRLPGADRTRIGFHLDLGAQVVAVVPQPITRNPDGSLQQARNQIVVHFNEDDLDLQSAANPAFYQLIFTNETVTNTDDVIHNPTGVDYDPASNTATLTFRQDLAQLATGPGTYRLRIGTDESVPGTPVAVQIDQEPGSSYATASDLGQLSNQSQILSEMIDGPEYPIEFPGGADEPGHRNINVQAHVTIGPDTSGGLKTVFYNFQAAYGQDPQGNQLFNLITDNQKQRARELFEIYSHYLGIQFVETPADGFTIVTGDIRALDPTEVVRPGGTLAVSGLHPDTMLPLVILDSAELWDDKFGETLLPNRVSWFDTAMHHVGHLLGLGHTDELPEFTLMNSDPELRFLGSPEAVFPGDHDVVHGRYLHRPDSNDIDLYRFELVTPGVFQAETIAERQAESSSLDTVLTLYREVDGQRQMVARNDDYFSEDSYLEMSLEPGTYFLGVTSTGNVHFDPTIENTGAGGTSQGAYDLRLDFRPRVNNFLTDATGTAFDGDADGVPGGIYDFWFRAVSEEETVYVDKAAADGGDGTLARPLNNLARALNDPDHRPQPGQVMRVVGNGGADGDVGTLADNLAYELGVSRGRSLADGSGLRVPQGVTVMVDAGAIFKMFKTNVHVGSSAVAIDRSGGALQVLGTPAASVIFTSYDDEQTGVDTNSLITQPSSGDWGGIIFQNDVDRAQGRFEPEQSGIFLNYVNHADLWYGGGNVTIDSVQQVIDPVHMIDARPTVSYNTIRFSADAALSANPDSFEETHFTAPDSLKIDYQATPFTPDYRRIGPDLRGNRLRDNSINGLFVRIATPAGSQLETLTVSGRFDDIDVVHVVPENLVIQSRPGGPRVDSVTGQRVARPDAQLKIDPAMVVKLDGARIEVGVGAQLLAEGVAGNDVIFTSLRDTRFGAGGTFVTSAPDEGVAEPARAGDWGGIYLGYVSRGSIDNALLAYGGGATRVEGSFARFNVIESHRGDLRLTNSVLEHNQNGRGGQSERTRGGRGVNAEGAIFVRGAQPIIVNNVITETLGARGAAININVNSLNHERVIDYGRSTGPVHLIDDFHDNQGPLIRGNRLADNSLNGMLVRGGTLTTEGVWDDTDIVHILFDQVVVPDFHTYGGLRLESSSTESLVVKLSGPEAGLVASGRPLDIEDRIGGRVHLLGQPGHPVVLTSLADDSVGAGFDPLNRPQVDTDGPNRGVPQQQPGSFQIDLNFGPNIRSNPAAVRAVEMAARMWERVIEDPITVTFDVEVNPALDDNTLGQATPETVTLDYEQVRQAMIADGRSHEEILALLPSFDELQATLPDDPANPFSVSREMRLTMANAKALGIDLSQLPSFPSQFDPTESRDALIEFHDNPIRAIFGGEPELFDYDRTDGVLSGAVDFVGVALHEVGHVLGFVSAVYDIDTALGGGGGRVVNLNTLDLFRLEPGAGAVDFTNAPRALDPAIDQVFFDGGRFDPFFLNRPGLRRGDIPMATGLNFGDGEEPGHFREELATLGLMDSVAPDSGESNITDVDRTVLDLIGWDIVGGPVPGDWRGITLEQYSHDRNVAVVSELEPAIVPAPGSNALPETAQLLGSLGRGEQNSDENLRLGFEVHGLLSAPADVDVYSFTARAGTEVWLDIDRTASSLNTVVELIDANGTVLARSDNSWAESQGLESRSAAPGMLVYGLQRSLFNPKDHWSTNMLDAGMRLLLPGAADGEGTYHVRVRSSSPDLDNLAGGLTAGAYQLQLRLGEVDELAGSTIQFADIRYAVDGIRVRGLPKHSPLVGEVAEDVWENAIGEPTDNNDAVASPDDSRTLIRQHLLPLSPDAPVPLFFPDSFQDAQFIGNILNSDRAAVSIAGRLDDRLLGEDNADWYLFEVRYDAVKEAGGNTAEFILDLDYADGLSRANTSVAIYQALAIPTTNPTGPEMRAGELIFRSEDALAAEDLPAPLQGADLDDLARGSVGRLDPLIGPFALQEGYYLLQVSNSQVEPLELTQYTERLPDNPYIRTEPIDSIYRIAEDHIGEPITEPGQGTTFDPPQVPLLVDNSSVVPFHLGDVELFVSTGTSFFTVDAFTGTREAVIGAMEGNVAEIGQVEPTIGDFALRDNPIFDRTDPDPEASRRQRIHAFAQNLGPAFPVDDANVGAYLNIQPAVLPNGNAIAQVDIFGDDGIETYEPNADDPAANADRANGGAGVGIIFDAMVFAPAAPDVEMGFAVGHHINDNAAAGPVAVENILYQFRAMDGLALSPSGMDVPPDMRIPDPAANAGTQIEWVGILDTTAGGGPGGRITGMAFAPGGMYAVSDAGGLYRIRGNRAQYVDTATELVGISFQGLTAGPANVEDGRYEDVLFAIDSGGELYAFNTAGELQPVFVDGQTSVSTGVRGAKGLDFATLDENLWHMTDRRQDDGHSGGLSFYFGEQGPENNSRNYDFMGGAHGSLVTHEFSLEGFSPDDLPMLYFNYFLATEEAYREADEAQELASDPNLLPRDPSLPPIETTARDTFRVFIADASRDDGRGQWHLLATNQLTTDELQFDLDPADDIAIPVQPLFDNTWQDVPFPGAGGANGVRDPFPYPEDDARRPFNPNGRPWSIFDPPLNETEGVWRQARIDLRSFAGSDTLRLRFDFSTAGSFDLGGVRSTGGTELHAIAGHRLTDGDTFVIDDQTFEFDLGYSVITRTGRAIADGETLTIADGVNAAVTFEFDRDGQTAAENIALPVRDVDTALVLAEQLADAIAANGPAELTVHRTDNRLNLEGATSVTQSPNAALIVAGAPGTEGIPVVVHAGMSAEEVAGAMVQPLADTFAGGVVETIKTYDDIVRIIGHKVDDPGPLGQTRQLPGDAFGNFKTSRRFLDNERFDYRFQQEEENFSVPFEGVFVDDLIIGFASRGEAQSDLRPQYPLFPDIPDIFAEDAGEIVPALDPDSISVGEYQIEIRRSSQYTVGGTPVRTFDPRDRFDQSVIIMAPLGADLLDGQTFSLSDGNALVTFEFEDSSRNDGVTEGNVAIPFDVLDSAAVIAERIRDAVNATYTANVLKVSASLSDGRVTGSGSTTNRVNLFGNAVLQTEPAPNGIEFLVQDETGGGNRFRDQGQLIIASNSITHSANFGIVVEDGLRDLPCTPGSPVAGVPLPCYAPHFDRADEEDHGQATAGDYTPHAGVPRNLREINDDRLAAGVTITNNVVAFGGEGGLHFSGDPGGVGLIGLVAGQPGLSEVWTGGPFTFSITDLNGLTQTFEFQGPGQQAAAGNIPVIWNPTGDCPGIHNVPDCSPRYSPLNPDTTDALMTAIAQSNLDVTIYRGRGDELFLEGAAEVVGLRADGVPGDWLYPFRWNVQAATVPFGRVVNNTVVGLGGSLPGDNLYNETDFRDTGILVEDHASPTLLNNIVVNFKTGIATDLSAADTLLGGNLFQGNLNNARNVDVGDFAIILDDDAPLFVDRERGNFYPAPFSRAIDSGVDSVEDRPELVTVKNPLGLSRSPILSPAYDVLGQLRSDDPRVEPPDGFGRNVFKDRGAVDRVDFVGPMAELALPKDNGSADQNPNEGRVRLDNSSLTRFVVQLGDLGTASSTVGTGIDDELVTGEAVTLLRDGVPLVEGIDYRFDYQATTNQIQLTPQAGVWLTGFTYEIVLVNQDQFVLTPVTGDQVADGDSFRITDRTGREVVFEFESGYTLQVPEPLTIQVPASTSGLADVREGDVFIVSDSFRVITFELDANGSVMSGRVPLPFSPSHTPEEVAKRIATALRNTNLGLEPQTLADGRVHVGGASNISVDTSLSGLTQSGASGILGDGQTLIIRNGQQTVTFEFDNNGTVSNSNRPVPFTHNDTQDQIAQALADAIAATDLPVEGQNVGQGRVHLGGTPGMTIRTGQSQLTVLGAPGLQTAGPNVVAIPYVPSASVDQTRMAQLIEQAVGSSALTGMTRFINEGQQVVVQGADAVTGLANQFVPGIRDLADNRLQTNQNDAPFEVRFQVDLPAPMDFGDAPDPGFTSLLANNGARHVVVPNIFLGLGIDAELDAKSNSDASGDMGDDGVEFVSPLVVGGSVPIRITASTAGMVDAWIDLNGNGRFDAAGEKVLDSQAVQRGVNTLRLAIPSSATAEATFARFRFSTTGGLGPAGRAENGEVEDYQVDLVMVDPPQATADAYTLDEDTTLQVDAQNGVLQNDNDPQGDSLTVVLVTEPANGQLELDEDGAFRYVPDADFAGTDQFQYRVSDGVQRSEIVTVELTITAIADPPIAVDDNVSVDEDSSVAINVLENDGDPDDALVPDSTEIVAEPANGTVTISPNGTVRYVPAGNFAGTDSFRYTVKDAEGAVSNEATVTVTVRELNDPPVAANDTALARQNRPVQINVLANDSDIDGTLDRRSVAITLSPKSGSVSVAADGSITFTPTASFVGTDTFRYVLRDDQGAVSNEALVTVTVSDQNLPPVAADDTAETLRDQVVRIDVLQNDSDADGMLVRASVTLVESPEHGEATVDGDGAVTYTPAAGFVGIDTFRYTVRDDGDATSNVAQVTVTVGSPGPPWQNPGNTLDVNGDGAVVPLDALLVINNINSLGSRPLPMPPLNDPPFSPPPYIDVNGDNFLSPLDALLVINHLNQANRPAAAAASVETAGERALVSETTIGAALQIQPRRRPLAGTQETVDQVWAAPRDSARPVELERVESPVRVLPDEATDSRSFDREDVELLLDDDLLDLLAGEQDGSF